MNTVGRLFQAFVAPAIFVSATALLILSVNVRLMGIVSRLRYFVHAKYDAEKDGRTNEAEAYTAQIQSIEKRAEIVRQCFLSALLSLAASIAACFLFGFGLYFQTAAVAAAVVFVGALVLLFVAAVHYIREVRVSLISVRDEVRDLRFMDLGTRSQISDSQSV